MLVLLSVKASAYCLAIWSEDKMGLESGKCLEVASVSHSELTKDAARALDSDALWASTSAVE